MCSAELTFANVDTGEIIILEDTELTITVTNITFTNLQLRTNHRYDVTVTASNVAGSATSQTMISKM